jgi:predicted short-subunit dehydrogenase-like oxidoreductase (DUF2520 family)
MLNSDVSIESLKIGFIGAGRLGRALAWSISSRGCHIHAVASRAIAESESLAERIQGCKIMTAQEVADACDLVFLTTPDDAIQLTADAIRWRPACGVVHCSGATEVSVLAKASEDGAFIGGFHPMQTFGDSETAARTLPGCVITIEADGLLNTTLVKLAAQLGCPVNQLPAGERGKYHAAAGYASQYINVVLGEAVRIWQSWGATEASALHALVPLVRGTLSSIEAAGLAKGMPGPVSRGDAGTVEKHLRSLSALDLPTALLYRDLCLRSVPLAVAAGGIDSVKAREIELILIHFDA